MKKKLKLKFLKERYSIVQLANDSKIQEWLNIIDNFISITRTNEELSIVFRTSSVLKNKIFHSQAKNAGIIYSLRMMLISIEKWTFFSMNFTHFINCNFYIIHYR